GARRIEELNAWQLANELRDQVHALTAERRSVDDWNFRNQLRDAVSSVTCNIAEGFGRYRHREFAQFLNIARGSLLEVTDHVRDAVGGRSGTRKVAARRLASGRRQRAPPPALTVNLKPRRKS